MVLGIHRHEKFQSREIANFIYIMAEWYCYAANKLNVKNLIPTSA